MVRLQIVDCHGVVHADVVSSPRGTSFWPSRAAPAARPIDLAAAQNRLVCDALRREIESLKEQERELRASQCDMDAQESELDEKIFGRALPSLDKLSLDPFSRDERDKLRRECARAPRTPNWDAMALRAFEGSRAPRQLEKQALADRFVKECSRCRGKLNVDGFSKNGWNREGKTRVCLSCRALPYDIEGLLNQMKAEGWETRLKPCGNKRYSHPRHTPNYRKEFQSLLDVARTVYPQFLRTDEGGEALVGKPDGGGRAPRRRDAADEDEEDDDFDDDDDGGEDEEDGGGEDEEDEFDERLNDGEAEASPVDRSVVDRAWAEEAARPQPDDPGWVAYVPQERDAVIYVAEAHHHQLLGNGVVHGAEEPPWRRDADASVAARLLRDGAAALRCVVDDVEYEMPEATPDARTIVAVVTLVVTGAPARAGFDGGDFVDVVDGANAGPSKAFVVRCRKCTAPDFLVPLQKYEAALRSAVAFAAGAELRVPYVNGDCVERWRGFVVRVDGDGEPLYPSEPGLAASLYDRVVLLMDGAEERCSPWECEPLEEHAFPGQRPLPALPEGAKASLLDAIGALKRRDDVPTVAFEAPAVAGLDDCVREVFLRVVPYPVDLQLLVDRLDGDYYRSLDAFRADAARLYSNCRAFHGAEHELTLAARALVVGLLAAADAAARELGEGNSEDLVAGAEDQEENGARRRAAAEERAAAERRAAAEERELGEDAASPGESDEGLGADRFARPADSPKCAICQYPLGNGETVTTLACSSSHRFHEDCLRRWIRRRHDAPLAVRTSPRFTFACPLCRAKTTRL